MNIQQKFLEDPQKFLEVINELEFPLNDLQKLVEEIEPMIYYLTDYDIYIEEIENRIQEIGMTFGLLDVNLVDDDDMPSDLRMYAIYTLVHERLGLEEIVPYAVAEDESLLEFSKELALKYKVKPL